MKKDILIGGVVGFFTGAFVLVILNTLEVNMPYQYAAALAGIPILWAAGVWLGYFLSRWIGFFRQFGKFATVGFLSASIDFAILNLISDATGITTGGTVGLINIPGFLVAVINGYLWNKLWVFRSDNGQRLFNDFLKFLAVTVMGLIINSTIVILLTTYVPIPSQMTDAQWLNVAKVLANIVGLIWNFVGYKFVVFRSNERSAVQKISSARF